MCSGRTAMATTREKDEARKPKKGSASETAPDEGGESALAVRERQDVELAEDAGADGEDGTDDPSAVAPGDSEDTAPTARQLGADRYVMAGFFAAGILGAYVLGRALQGVWSSLSNRDWFNRALPALAAVSDDDKATYGTVLAGVIALIMTLRTYRRPDVRAWTDEVASELMKVKWPTKKEVSNSTVVVIAASALATLYLALLDRLWAFVTNIVYGTGS